MDISSARTVNVFSAEVSETPLAAQELLSTSTHYDEKKHDAKSDERDVQKQGLGLFNQPTTQKPTAPEAEPPVAPEIAAFSGVNPEWASQFNSIDKLFEEGKKQREAAKKAEVSDEKNKKQVEKKIIKR
jgi:hypothetical protein